MSYSVKYSKRAQRTLGQLGIDLQELVIDDVELVAASAPQLNGSGFVSDVVHDFVHEANGTRHYVFLVVDYDHDSRVVEIPQIGHCAIPLIS